MPSIEPTIPLTPEDGDEPFDEDATGDPVIPGEVPVPATAEEVKPLPPDDGEQDEDSPLGELGIPSELIPHRRPV